MVPGVTQSSTSETANTLPLERGEDGRLHSEDFQLIKGVLGQFFFSDNFYETPLSMLIF